MTNLVGHIESISGDSIDWYKDGSVFARSGLDERRYVGTDGFRRTDVLAFAVALLAWAKED